jgi:N-acetylglucosaminyl-diphospho-decaprenol L-rhamnosyltransferase
VSGAAITVVVVTWNGAPLLADCLNSLREQNLDAGRYEVMVVDNASTDNTREMVLEHFPWASLIVSERNLGYGGGANLGIAASRTPYVALLNNDARAHRDWLGALLGAFGNSAIDRVAAVTSRVVLLDTERLNSTGGLVSRTGRGFDRSWNESLDRAPPRGEVFGFSGAAAALSKEALDEVGVFDRDLFMYYEDTDLSWRLRSAGWKITYEPDATVKHQHAATSGAGSEFFTYWNERNSLIVFTRHAPPAIVVAILIRRIVGLALHTARRPRSPVTRARWRAAWAYLRRLRVTLEERREKWADPRVSRREIGRWLEARPPG